MGGRHAATTQGESRGGNLCFDDYLIRLIHVAYAHRHYAKRRRRRARTVELPAHLPPLRASAAPTAGAAAPVASGGHASGAGGSSSARGRGWRRLCTGRVRARRRGRRARDVRRRRRRHPLVRAQHRRAGTGAVAAVPLASGAATLLVGAVRDQLPARPHHERGSAALGRHVRSAAARSGGPLALSAAACARATAAGNALRLLHRAGVRDSISRARRHTRGHRRLSRRPHRRRLPCPRRRGGRATARPARGSSGAAPPLILLPLGGAEEGR